MSLASLSVGRYPCADLFSVARVCCISGAEDCLAITVGFARFFVAGLGRTERFVLVGCACQGDGFSSALYFARVSSKPGAISLFEKSVTGLSYGRRDTSELWIWRE